MTEIKRKKRKSAKTTKILLITLVVFTLIIGGTAVWGVNKFRDMVGNAYDPLEDGEQRTPVRNSKKLESFTLMMLGIDSRDGENARSDTMILAVVNPHIEQVMLVSLPRDTYVNVPGYGNTKLNHAMAYGNVPLAKKTVEGFFNIKVDNYMTVDFNGFKKAVDVLGGVHVDVEKDMKYRDPTDGTNINLKKGYQLLDGKNSLDYVRFRADSENDFGRMRRQQQFLRAVVDKMTQFTSFTKVIPFVDSVSEGVKTDIHPDEIELLVKKFFGISGTAIQSETIECRGFTGKDGLSYEEVSNSERDRIARVIEEFKNKKE